MLIVYWRGAECYLELLNCGSLTCCMETLNGCSTTLVLQGTVIGFALRGLGEDRVVKMRGAFSLQALDQMTREAAKVDIVSVIRIGLFVNFKFFCLVVKGVAELFALLTTDRYL